MRVSKKVNINAFKPILTLKKPYLFKRIISKLNKLQNTKLFKYFLETLIVTSLKIALLMQ